MYLLFILHKACKVVKIHDFFLTAVGDHYQIEVPACGNHLVEWTEFFKAQRALVLVCVCILQITTKVYYEQEIGLPLSVCVIWDNHPAKENMSRHTSELTYFCHHQTWWSSFTLIVRREAQWATELKQYCSATKAICSAVTIWHFCDLLLHGSVLPKFCIYIYSIQSMSVFWLHLHARLTFSLTERIGLLRKHKWF